MQKLVPVSFRSPLSLFSCIKYITAISIFLVAFSLHTEKDYFFPQRAGVMFFVSLGVAGYFYRRYGILEFITALYILLHVTFIAFWKKLNYVTDPVGWDIAEKPAVLGVLSTLLIVIVVTEELIERKLIEFCFLCFGFFLCLHFWIYQRFYFHDGHLMTQTLAGVFLGLLLPIARKYSPTLMALFTVTGIATCGHTAIATIGAFYFGLTIEKRWKYWPLVPGGIGVITGVIAWMRPSWLTNDNFRFRAWRAMFDFINTNNLEMFGLGVGTTTRFCGWITKLAGVEFPSRIEIVNGKEVKIETVMQMLHNEPLQIYFELGIVGLILFGLLYMKGLSSKTLPFMFALLVSSLTMFPLRHETFLFLVVFQLHEIYKKPHIPELV